MRPAGKRQTRDMVQKFKPSIVVIVETHCASARVEKFWNKLGFFLGACSKAQGHSGGIWILVDKGCNFIVSILDIHHQVLTISVSKGSSLWCCSAIYASPIPAVHENLWSHLGLLRQSITSPWLLIGDFNEILSPLEVSKGAFSSNRADKFHHVLEICNLMDLGAKGHKFTWYRKEEGRRSVSKSVDRALADVDWITSFSGALMENLVRIHSDHCPLLLRCKDSVPNKNARPFTFQAAWLSHNDFPGIVNEAWQKGDHRVPCSLHHVK